MKAIAIIAVGAVSLLGIASCSSDKKLGVPPADTDSEVSAPNITVPGDADPDIDNPDITLPGGGSLPDIPDISLPANIPGLTEGCAAFYQAFAAALSGGDATTFDALPEAMDNLKKSLPEDLHGDLETVGEAFQKLAAVYAKYNYDFAKAATDPELGRLFSDQNFTEASTNIESWLDDNCETG